MIEMVDSMEELRAALEDPEGWLKKIASGMGAVAKRLLVAKLRPALEPHATDAAPRQTRRAVSCVPTRDRKSEPPRDEQHRV